MAMRREGELQGDLLMTWAEMPRSPGHVFYNRLQELLSEAGFDAFVEETCKPFYAPKMGAPSLPPGRYFRMHMIGYFEGLASERGIVWRCADSRSLGDFLRLGSRDKVPDHSWLSKTRSRNPEGGRGYQSLPVRHSDRRGDYRHDPRRVRRRWGGADHRGRIGCRLIKSRLLHRAVKDLNAAHGNAARARSHGVFHHASIRRMPPSK